MSLLPWVAGPGETLPPAPILWARFDREGNLADVAPCAEPMVPGIGADVLARMGWVLVVDEHGRSR